MHYVLLVICALTFAFASIAGFLENKTRREMRYELDWGKTGSAWLDSMVSDVVGEYKLQNPDSELTRKYSMYLRWRLVMMCAFFVGIVFFFSMK